MAILSEGGGPISQAVDALAERGLDLPVLSAETEARLKKITPNATQLNNPVDAGGGTDPHPRYMPACGEAILADPAVDALLIVGYFGGYQVRYGTPLAEAENEAALKLAAFAKEAGKPVIVQCHYAEFQTEAIDILRAADITVVRSIEIAAACPRRRRGIPSHRHRSPRDEAGHGRAARQPSIGPAGGRRPRRGPTEPARTGSARTAGVRGNRGAALRPAACTG